MRQMLPYHRSQVSIAAKKVSNNKKLVYNTTPGVTVPLFLLPALTAWMIESHLGAVSPKKCQLEALFHRFMSAVKTYEFNSAHRFECENYPQTSIMEEKHI